MGRKWKRFRRSPLGQPDQKIYEQKCQQLVILHTLAALGYIDLRFGDETGFSMAPSVPYGWLPVGSQRAIRSDSERVTNVFGLMNRRQQLSSYPTQGHINAEFIIQCLDNFCTTIPQLTVVVLDNASWHTARAIQARREAWQEQGLFLFYLPTYSPHLNPIEILWRKIKYEWLKPEAYSSKEQLQQAIFNILRQFGTEFQINFSLT
ncbi:IS630 family transposase [Tunicatimonas pelagia]|uniref:IS630 family transposase n=1 Tax=Tunicatimonas pelagia TaxID=931531 RepID=UPI002665E83F|nr:IS630 family transposase [Tunicatimonas pelagia]WKN46320.1 IS630 family transposase [Tunicatimonas pelagia]WKN46373.1 IS630 family transposase [Tunicatimonas pelagia]WKN46381.1 IS630 family transposase [Tunicatimonas pelagia]